MRDRSGQPRSLSNAKRAGIEIVHGFFTVGNPDETVDVLRATFDFAARLPLDTFNFNRLCVYRGTPLWEYRQRNLVDDATDWFKYFKCSEIDPTCLPGETINRERTAGFRRLFLYKLLHYPVQTARLLHRFSRFMRTRDLVYLIVKPFLGKRRGATPAEKLSRAIEYPEFKDSAPALTHMADAMLEQALAASKAERGRLQPDS